MMATRRSTPAAEGKPTTRSTRKPVRRWSKKVNEESDAMDVQHDIFKQPNPRTIAQSLKRSAERSKRRKSEPFRSAMSMLNFYINRAGRNLPQKQLTVLERAKVELRIAFHRPSAGR